MKRLVITALLGYLLGYLLGFYIGFTIFKKNTIIVNNNPVITEKENIAICNKKQRYVETITPKSIHGTKIIHTFELIMPDKIKNSIIQNVRKRGLIKTTLYIKL